MHTMQHDFNGDFPNANANSNSNANANSNNNLDRVLYNDLVQMVPLVQSLIERKASGSFTRRGSMIYTKTPSKESRKNGVKSTNGKKHGDREGKESKNDQDEASDNNSTFSTNMAAEKDREELIALRAQLEDLHQKLLEKDELLKAAEISKNQMSSVQSQVDELKRCTAEKDYLIKSIQSQLNDAKIKLADKQAALEKLQWEAKTSDEKVELLQEELDSMQSQISSLMIIFEGLSSDAPIRDIEDYDVTPHFVDGLPNIDDLDEMEMQNMEEAREAYLLAVEMAKEKQDEESIYAAARARFRLQSFVFRTNDLSSN